MVYPTNRPIMRTSTWCLHDRRPAEPASAALGDSRASIVASTLTKPESRPRRFLGARGRASRYDSFLSLTALHKNAILVFKIRCVAVQGSAS